MNKSHIVALASLMLAVPAQAQEPPPRLVVVIAVDQLREDYLDRFAPHFGSGGFRLLFTRGARFTDASFVHAGTMTCPGHAVMMTGAHAAIHGIIGNDWWNLDKNRKEYCGRDDDAPLVGIVREGRSPRNLIASTVGDEMKLSNRHSKVITVSGKDRSAIMLGGKSADAVYWMEDTLFVSSRYYLAELPAWVKRYNASGEAARYFGARWDRLLPEPAYASQGPDDAPWERNVSGMGRAFPHVLGATERVPGPAYFKALEYSPFQNEMVVDLAIEAVREERLGADSVPDLLGIGLSGNDHIGHAFGPDSHEVMDITVRTDRLLSRFFAFLDAQIGLDDVLIVLTSDHGVAPVPEAAHAASPGLGALRLLDDEVKTAAETIMTERFGPPARQWIAYHDYPWLYFDESELAGRGIAIGTAESALRDAVAQFEYVTQAWTRADLRVQHAAGLSSPTVLSFHPDRSGHVTYETRPWVVVTSERDGTTHGTPWAYDRSVPLLWFGRGIRPGEYADAASIADIAPTLSRLLRIERPPAATGRVLTEMLAPQRNW